jgi:hypothetical protein
LTLSCPWNKRPPRGVCTGAVRTKICDALSVCFSWK